MYFCGHQHNYQRLYPNVHGKVDKDCVSDDHKEYKNCPHMTTVVAGSPGCQEKISGGHAPDAALVTFKETYGFGHLHVYNATHIFWGWEEVAAKTARMLSGSRDVAYTDEFWLIHT